MSARFYASSSALEKAYVRGLREGERRGAARLADKRAQYNELVIRHKAAIGGLRRQIAALKSDGLTKGRSV